MYSSEKFCKSGCFREAPCGWTENLCPCFIHGAFRDFLVSRRFSSLTKLQTHLLFFFQAITGGGCVYFVFNSWILYLNFILTAKKQKIWILGFSQSGFTGPHFLEDCPFRVGFTGRIHQSFCWNAVEPGAEVTGKFLLAPFRKNPFVSIL